MLENKIPKLCVELRDRFHESQQKDSALFNRLCPAEKDGSRKFAPVMLKRLQKLGIDKTNPNDLTPEGTYKLLLYLLLVIY